ncbi:MAG TPA: response regulator [Acidobacteriota bacterium]|jgi:DNA-binding response OmpR family regulator
MPKILVVDDEEAIRRFLKKFLEKKNYEVLTAANGLEAVEKARQEKPHLVLLDMYMPHMGGLEALSAIKKENGNLGIIVITGVNDEKLGRAALRMGAFDYITKPFNLEHLEKVLWWKIKLIEEVC